MKLIKERISPLKKKKILAESFAKEAELTNIAAKYNISNKTLHNWRYIWRKQNTSIKASKSKKINTPPKSTAFIQLKPIDFEQNQNLQNVSFDFGNYNIKISGKFCSKVLEQILLINSKSL